MTAISRRITLSTLATVMALATAAHAQNDTDVQAAVAAAQADKAAHGDLSVKIKTTEQSYNPNMDEAVTISSTKVNIPEHQVIQGVPNAETVDESQYPPLTDPDSQLVYISGGIGDTEGAYFKQLHGDYTFKLLMADKDGHLVSDATVTICDAKDKKLATFSGVGPYLLVKLPAGKYKITTTLNGVDVTSIVHVKAGKITAIDARF